MKIRKIISIFIIFLLTLCILTNSTKAATNKISISKATVSSVVNQKYTGGSIKPDVTIRYKGEKLTKGTDYTLSYKNNKNVGTATITITGKGNYTGTKKVNFKIVKYGSSSTGRTSISKATVSSIVNQKYTGSAIKPNVTVRYQGERLTKGTDYTVSYSNNTKRGTATITITGKGNYTGTKKITFKIM